jgi:hypothetical protein
VWVRNWKEIEAEAAAAPRGRAVEAREVAAVLANALSRERGPLVFIDVAEEAFYVRMRRDYLAWRVTVTPAMAVRSLAPRAASRCAPASSIPISSIGSHPLL